MKNSFVLSIIVFSVLFFACEDEIIPIPLPPSQPAVEVPTETKAEPPQQVIEEKPEVPAKTAKKTQVKESVKAPSKEPAKTVAYFDGDADQLSKGRYVIQVAIFPIESSARKMIKKLADEGIKAYNAKVDNPNPEKGMIGTYNRVRIGFFDAKPAAEAFAKTKLEPLGYAWWVDRSRNDNVGKLSYSEPEPVFEVERIPEKPKQMSEQERREAERAAAIAAAKEEYRAIAKAATANVALPPPTIPAKAPKAAPPPPAAKAPPPKLAPPPPAAKAPPPLVSKTAAPAAAKTKKTEPKEAEIDNRGRVKMKSKRSDS